MTLTRKAHAKINWSLDVLGTREDGYHLLDMVMQQISLCDTLTFSPADSLRLSLSDASSVRVPADGKNLVLRAAEALRARAGISLGADITLEKHIPVCAGLGGGSADAAAALRGLCALWGLRLSTDELCALALPLGADIPYCLRGGAARVGGIGETYAPVPCARAFDLVLCRPCRGLSTRDVFSALPKSALARPDTDIVLEGLRAGSAALLCQGMRNALQDTACALRPQIRAALRDLREYGARAAMMTGSGACVFGVFTSARAAGSAYNAMRRRYDLTYCAATVDERNETDIREDDGVS